MPLLSIYLSLFPDLTAFSQSRTQLQRPLPSCAHGNHGSLAARSKLASADPRTSLLCPSQDLWLNDNALADWPALQGRLRELRASLQCVYVANNPATPDLDAVQVGDLSGVSACWFLLGVRSRANRML